MKTEKKVVLITGAAHGIGAATAKQFAQKNYNVIIHYYTSEEEAKQLKKELEDNYATQVLLVKADIQKEKEIDQMVDKIKEHYTNIDVLINNAALTLDNELEEKSQEEFEQVMKTNVIGTFLVTKKIAHLIQKGSIVNVSSTNGIDTQTNYSIDYDASKAAIISLTKNFAHIYAPNIRVNTICPGWTNTKIVTSMNPEYLQEETNKILLARFAEPDEIAKVIFFLASEEASYINNAIIRVDGGIK